MTAEHLTLLLPSDLRSMRIVCAKCHGSLSIRLNETVRVPNDCPVCGQAWKDGQSSGSATAAENLVNSLKSWLSIEHEKKPPFSLQFEIVNTP